MNIGTLADLFGEQITIFQKRLKKPEDKTLGSQLDISLNHLQGKINEIKGSKKMFSFLARLEELGVEFYDGPEDDGSENFDDEIYEAPRPHGDKDTLKLIAAMYEAEGVVGNPKAALLEEKDINKGR